MIAGQRKSENIGHGIF